jgi:4-amino-4-deoxy-L-arabinose transferase-like glycosyltransferase
MPTETLAADARPGWRRGWPEALVGLLAAVIFLGCLGSVDLWGKREQRAAAEAIDTVERQYWLVAEIQGRPRLEKPPLPRWMIAGSMLVTGRRDAWAVRLPSAICALGTVALIYALGRRMGGRPVGLASAMILSSSGLFVGELRQAGHDGPLAFLTTLALYAAWHLLDEEGLTEVRRAHGDRPWRLLFSAALGLGFLCKGPIVLMLTSAAIVPYLIQAGRLGPGLRRLVDAPGLLIFAAIAASWPVAVAWRDPDAPRLWLMEMSEKTGVLGILIHRRHTPLVREWPNMMFPWSIVAMASLILPFLPGVSRAGEGDGRPSGAQRTSELSPTWFAWWWAVASMGIFCLWSVAKPNYYLPCVPGMALLTGMAWVRWARRARESSTRGSGRAARAVLQAQWVLLFVGGILAAIAVRPWIPPSLRPLTLVLAAVLAAAIAVSVRAWRRGADAMALAPIVSALALGVLVVYGILAPADNPRRGHRELARTLDRLVPHDVRSIHFFNEVDEGLGFYLDGLDLLPVPGTQPLYSTAYDLFRAYHDRREPSDTPDLLDARREAVQKEALLRWLDRRDPSAPFLLIHSSLFDRYARELAGRVTPVFRETGLSRKELTLLRALDPSRVAVSASPARR